MHPLVIIGTGLAGYTLAGQPTAIDSTKPVPVIVKTPSYPLALVPPPVQLAGTGAWSSAQQGVHTICRFFDSEGILQGFGLAPQEAGLRQALLGELGKAEVATA
jgi:rubredoxin-NAD+ reductase